MALLSPWCRVSSKAQFVNVRTTVLSDTLEDAFRRRYPGFRPVNDEQRTTAAAA